MVSLSTIRTDLYAAIRSLVNANKLSGTTIVNSFPEADPAFPCVVMPMPDVAVSGAVSFDGDKREYTADVEFGFWATALESQGQAKVAAMMDNLQATLENNQTTGSAYLTDNIVLVSMSPSSVDRVEVNNQKLYTAGLLVQFQVTA